jgi:hypothetical protein
MATARKTASTDKKEYQAVLATLLGRGTLTSFINKLVKAWTETEDAKLKQGLARIINELHDLARSAKGSTSISMPLDDERYKSVVEYCGVCIRSVKPQWQIIAEQHGWGPNK